ncbi:MAG TPA: hypothetical protein VFA29_05135 [Candidatus Baltobacteraceae bacterium]|nr:hypothetical protein [Candidatus Baltobacteraceae bacterium]
MRARIHFFAASLITSAILLGSASPAFARPTAAKPVLALRVAPADEYFGRLKLSILGIRNQLRDLGLRLQYAPERGADVLGAASFVEDALHDWERKYPADPWLAKSVYQLTSLYAQIHSAEGTQNAARAFRWLQSRYAHTQYAAQARTELSDTLK